jgi:hypothetical protein
VKANTEDLEVVLGKPTPAKQAVVAPQKEQQKPLPKPAPVPREGGVVSGTVLDAATGRPLPGATVKFLGHQDRVGAGPERTGYPVRRAAPYLFSGALSAAEAHPPMKHPPAEARSEAPGDNPAALRIRPLRKRG